VRLLAWRRRRRKKSTAGPNILWTVHLMPFYALAVYSSPPRSHHDLGPTARLFVVAYAVHVSSRHFPGLWGRSRPSFYQRLRALGWLPTNVIGDALSLSGCHDQYAGTCVHFDVLLGVISSNATCLLASVASVLLLLV
jgi:hypothetical protein